MDNSYQLIEAWEDSPVGWLQEPKGEPPYRTEGI
jgi:hypothetical protein